MVWELLHQFAVKMGAIVTVFVHINAHWMDTTRGEEKKKKSTLFNPFSSSGQYIPAHLVLYGL